NLFLTTTSYLFYPTEYNKSTLDINEFNEILFRHKNINENIPLIIILLQYFWRKNGNFENFKDYKILIDAIHRSFKRRPLIHIKHYIDFLKDLHNSLIEFILNRTYLNKN